MKIGYLYSEKLVSGPPLDITFRVDLNDIDATVLNKCVSTVGGGDTLYIESLEMFGSISEVHEIVKTLVGRGVTVILHKGRLRFNVENPVALQTLTEAAKFEQRVATKKLRRIRKVGRPPKRCLVPSAKLDSVIEAINSGEMNKTEAAKLLGVSRPTFYGMLKVRERELVGITS